MAERKPLVIISGQVQQLPVGDVLETSGIAVPGSTLGAKMRYVSASQVTLGNTGEMSRVAASNVSELIEWTGLITADVTILGAGGRDAGVETANTWYYVFAIGGGGNPVVALLSTSLTPSLPGSYTSYRRLGAIRNDSGSNLLPFIQVGSGGIRRYFWNTDNLNVQILSAGAATAFTAVSTASFIPPTATNGTLLAKLDTNNASRFAELRPNGSGITAGNSLWTLFPTVNTNTDFFFLAFEIPILNNSVDYRVSHAAANLTLFVQGFDDEL